MIRSFSAAHHQLLNSNLHSLAGAEPETDAFLQRCIITNHTRFFWAYECNDQSEALRLVIAETLEFCSLCTLADWILLSDEFAHHKQQSADVRTNVIYAEFILHDFQNHRIIVVFTLHEYLG